LSRRPQKRLRVADTVSLGEKRFVAILRVDGEQFLLGGSSSNVVLLARLESSSEVEGSRSSDSFDATLDRMLGRDACGPHVLCPVEERTCDAD
jgi:flagellar biogenesis protein FliO